MCKRNELNEEELIEMIKKTEKMDLNQKEDKTKKTILHYLAGKEKIKLTTYKYLLEKNANPNLKDKYQDTPLHLLCTQNKPDFEVLRLFAQFNGDLNSINGEESTPFHLISRKQHPPCSFIDFFLSNKANPNALDSNGVSPFHEICKTEINLDQKLIEIFLLNNADPNLVSEDNSIFMEVCQNLSVTTNIIKLFLEYNSNESEVDSLGKLKK